MARVDGPRRGVDFVTIDGGEGGTGAAPLIFTDSVSLPFQLGFARVYATFARKGLHEDVVFVGGGKLGLPDNAVIAFAAERWVTGLAESVPIAAMLALAALLLIVIVLYKLLARRGKKRPVDHEG